MPTVLIATDIQPDFEPGGPLGVTDGDAVIPATLVHAAQADLVIATRDWHPADHCSFREQGGIWEPHCVAGTPGAEIEEDILAVADIVVSKAFTSERDAYSAFDAPVRIEKHPDGERVGEICEFADLLREVGAEQLIVTGLATDYCVKGGVLGALASGFPVRVPVDAVRAVDVSPGDGEAALAEMADAGAEIVR